MNEKVDLIEIKLGVANTIGVEEIVEKIPGILNDHWLVGDQYDGEWYSENRKGKWVLAFYRPQPSNLGPEAYSALLKSMRHVLDLLSELLLRDAARNKGLPLTPASQAF